MCSSMKRGDVHEVDEVDPALEVLPAGHAVHVAVELNAENFPAVQTVHTLE